MTRTKLIFARCIEAVSAFVKFAVCMPLLCTVSDTSNSTCETIIHIHIFIPSIQHKSYQAVHFPRTVKNYYVVNSKWQLKSERLRQCRSSWQYRSEWNLSVTLYCSAFSSFFCGYELGPGQWYWFSARSDFSFDKLTLTIWHIHTLPHTNY